MEFAHAAQIPAARRALVDVCRLMHERRYIAAGDGNVSVRIGQARLLVTPTGSRKGFMSPGDMVLCDLDGQPARGESNRPSSEMAMHIEVYRQRPDVMAVVHAHPPCAIAHTIAGRSLAAPLMPEVYCALGEIVTLPYTTPTTSEVPAALRSAITNHNALLMERHGSITVGDSLAQAYDRLEVLEHTAQISLMAHQLSPGGIEGLSAEQIARLVPICG